MVPDPTPAPGGLVDGLIWRRAAAPRLASGRVFVDTAEIGAAWTKASHGGRDCLALDLDDPSVAPPVFADLAEAEDGTTRRLTWSRQSGRGED